MRRELVIGSVLVASGALFVASLPSLALAASDTQAQPPNQSELRQATTAMLQPGMVPAVLGGPGDQQIGYYIPTGGQDPYPVCQPPSGAAVIPDLTSTTGYFSANGNNGDEIVYQQSIVYPSAETAQLAWTALAKKIEAECSFTGKGDDKGVVIRNGDIAGTDGLWSNYTGGSKNGWSEYTAVGLSDDAIVSLRFTDFDRERTSAEQHDAVNALWAQLSTQFANRSVPSGVQSTTLSIAEAAMLTPSDVGPDIPIGTPEEGSWSSFTASLPGTAPLDPCRASLNFFPGGNGSFSASFGDDGGPFIENGMIWQRAFTYANSDAADAAWRQMSRKLAKCDQRSGTLFSQTKSGSRQVAGQSAVTVDGTPGWFIREVDTNGSKDKGSRFTTRTYQLLLKNGNVISWVTYGKTNPGVKQFFIDEPPINELAVTLLDRFVNTVVTTG